MIVLTLFVARTQLGRAMRATSFDREAAAMMGVDVDRVISSTFFIGSALAGAAGVMFGLAFGQIYHFMGFLAGLKGFTAAVVGGIGSIPGAMLGGLLVGSAESFAQGYANGNWSDLIVFSILIVVHARAADGPARDARDPEGLKGTRWPTSRRSPSSPTSRGSASTRGSPPRTSGSRGRAAPAGSRSARSSERRRRSASPRSSPLAATLPLFLSSGNLFRYGFFTLVYIMLGLGLNVVVGFAGLLDLGYVAFYGIGAYTYAILSSDLHGIHWPAEVTIPIAIVVSAVLGLTLGLSSRRLLGDYLAIVTLFFGQAFVTFANNANPKGLTGGANGIGSIDNISIFGYTLTSTSSTTTSSSAGSPSCSRRCGRSSARASAARGWRCARTRSRLS